MNPGGGVVKQLPTRRFPEFDQPFLSAVIGEADVADLANLACVSRIVGVSGDGTPVTAGQLEASLTLGGFDRFAAVMGIRGLNVRLPRTSYAA